MVFYAVRRGRTPGIYENWNMCEAQVKGFPGAKYKKFKTASDAQAFIDDKSEENAQNATGSEEKAETAERVVLLRKVPQELFAKGTKDIPKENTPKENSNLQSNPEVSVTNNAKRTMEVATGQPPSKRQKNESQKIQGVASNNASVKTPSIDVYTHGVCAGNGTDDAKAAIGVYWGPDHPMNVSERLPGRQTRPRAEIHAARRAIQQAKEMGRQEVRLFTDSEFVVNAMTNNWIQRWRTKNWRAISGEPVKNREDFEQLEVAMKGMKVHWIKVGADRGVPGYERAVELANLGVASKNASVKTPSIDVYTHGVCAGNGTEDAKAAIGVYWGPDHPMNVSERLPGLQTRPRAEIHAARRAIQQAKEMGRQEVRLFTDSEFVVNAMTKWIKRWKQNNWKLISGEPVKNPEDFKQLEEAADGMKVEWIKVGNDRGVPGYERADELANLGLQKPPVY